MSGKAYYIFNIITGLIKASALLSILFWLLPRWGIIVPAWGIALIVVAFLSYEVITFNLGKRALFKKPVICSNEIVGRKGKATTTIAPDGYVQVDGELWRARSIDACIQAGDEIIVVELSRLTVFVSPVQASPEK